jgi:hypothetical protein
MDVGYTVANVSMNVKFTSYYSCIVIIFMHQKFSTYFPLPSVVPWLKLLVTGSKTQSHPTDMNNNNNHNNTFSPSMSYSQERNNREAWWECFEARTCTFFTGIRHCFEQQRPCWACQTQHKMLPRCYDQSWFHNCWGGPSHLPSDARPRTTGKHICRWNAW